jgi:hypothetical protein
LFGAGLSNPNVEFIQLDPNNPALLYAGTLGNSVYASDDSGQSWH